MSQPLADELKTISMSPNLAQSLDRAHRSAQEQSHRLVTLEHLLLALTDDPEAALILQAADVDLTRLRADASSYLGGLMEDMRVEGAAEPRPDPELLKVLQAAGSAATQSKRRQIDGAIVLAAIVGDAKSPAAGLLKALGMTFEEAIRALQRANAQARFKTKPAVAASPAPVSPEPAAVAPAPAPVAVPAPPADSPPAVAPASQPAASAAPASPDDFLAAARARIQQRAAAAAAAHAQALAKVDTPPPVVPAPEDTEAAPKPPSPPAAPPPSVAPEAETGPAAAAPADAAPAVPPAAPVAASATPDPSEDLLVPPDDDPSDPSGPAISSLAERLEAAATAPRTPKPSRSPAGLRAAIAANAPPQGPPLPPGPAQGAMPLPGRPVQAADGPPRPPLPPGRAAPPLGALTGPPPGPARPGPAVTRPAGVPWPEGPERGPQMPMRPGPGPGPAALNGRASPPRAPGAPTLSTPQPRPPQRKPGAAPARRGGPAADKSGLTETIPRHLNAGVAATGEVRALRDRIEALLPPSSRARPMPQSGLLPGAPYTRAVTVRLRAADAGVGVEPVSPETQWIDSGQNFVAEDHAVWRWTLHPRTAGRHRLVLQISVRTVAPDGSASDVALPDRFIETRVKRALLRTVMRWVGWVLAFLAGAGAVYAGRELFDGVWEAVRSLLFA